MMKAGLLAGLAGFFLAAAPAAAQSAATAKLKTIVLVHGAWADGSGWEAVYNRLVKDGYKVWVSQHPTETLPSDVEYVKRILAMTGDDVVLVGHSYGGAVITEAGNDPKVKALVFVAAFEPDVGESVMTLEKYPAPGATPPPVLPPVGGYVLIDPAKFPEAFAQNVDPAVAKFMAISQVPSGVQSVQDKITQAAWRTKPSWAVLTTQDRMIPPSTQTYMTKRSKAKVTEVASSHAVYVAKPDIVAKVIEEAAHGVR